jgi:type IV secretion system protein VirD4
MGKKKPLKKNNSGSQKSKSSNSNSIFKKILKDIKKSIKIDKKTIKMNIPFILFAWVGNKLSYAWNSSGGDVATFMQNINACLTNPIPSFAGIDILVGIGAVVAIKLILYFKKKNKKNFRDKEEYGSARWGNEKDIEPYTNQEDFYNNIILTQTESLTMEGRPQSGVKYARNKNILVVGGSGSGKTRFFIKPNIMQMHSSYVVTDPKGTVLLEVGKMLEENGYEIKVLNTINFDKSMHYNPFAYIHNEEDILKLVNTIISNTKGDGDKGGEDFWVKAERLLYTAYIGLIYYEFPEEEQNFSTLIDLINSSETREDDENFENAVDRIFNELEEGVKVIERYEVQKDEKGNEQEVPIYKQDENGEYVYEIEPNPNHFAVRMYKKYKLAAGKTAKSILISCGARLAPFDIEALRNIMAYDEMQLDTLGRRKTALFVIVSYT